MTAPAPPCACRTAVLGVCAGRVRACLTPGAAFHAAVEHREDGAPAPWPANTQAELRFTWATGGEVSFPATVDGPWLRWELTPAQTRLVPRGARPSVWLDYSGDGSMFFPWLVGDGGCGC